MFFLGALMSLISFGTVKVFNQLKFAICVYLST